MVNKFINKARSVLNLKRIYSSEVFYSAIKQNTLETKFTTKPSTGRVMILAPHPDDEIIGCGGALLKHIAQEDKVKIVYLTDGSLGFEDGFKPTLTERKGMAKIREEEAKKLQELGEFEQIFLRYPDSKLSLSKSLLNYLSQALKEFKPDIIYTPYLLDPLSDHCMTSKALAACLKPSRLNPIINQYEVWSPGFCNLYLALDDVIDDKIKALQNYKSQLKARDYVESTKGLAAYRSMIFGKSRYAESYLSTNAKIFVKLVELLD